MPTHEFEKPWQVMPAKIIKLALEHAEKKDDFDHQIAFLLLDIGVEAALKTYLVNKGHDVEKMHFPELLRKVREELSKAKPNLIRHVDDVGYFHGIRNKLYHQGDGVKPTEGNLKRYSDLARKIIEEIVEVNLKTEEKKFVVPIDGRKQEVEDLVRGINERFEHFQENCGFVTEKHKPAFATREFEMELKYIADNWRDWDAEDLEDRLEDQNQRVKNFNELTGMKQTSSGFVDYVLEDVNHLYVLVALRQTNENWTENWKEYTKLDERRYRLVDKWKSDIHSNRMTIEQVRKEFEGIVSWLETQDGKVVEWIDAHFQHSNRTVYQIMEVV